MPKITFTVPGEPVGKGRPRFSRTGCYTPEKTKSYENKVKWMFAQAASDWKMIQRPNPVSVTLDCLFTYPESWTEKQKAFTDYHTSTPDADNIVKAVCDALNKLAYQDDGQVAQIHCIKHYAHSHGQVTVTIETL
jgi:Holliday junction resolvase RusA-like endonuclease